MADIVSPNIRSRMMSGIRSKNTIPELAVRRKLHSIGFRYRIHDKRYPGKPDMVFPKYNAVILVHGCFWHGHNCHLFKWPSSRSDFWHMKIERNKAKDKENLNALALSNWRILTIWECSLKGITKLSFEKVISNTTDWLQSSSPKMEIRGREG